MSVFNPFLRYPVASLAIAVVLCLPWALRWVHLEISTETQALLEGDQRNLTTYEKVRDLLRQEVVVVINLRCGPVFTRQGMDRIRRVSEAFRQQPGLVDVKSMTHSVKPVRRGLGFEMVPLVSADPGEAELAELRRYSLENPLIRNVMVSPDEEHTILLNTYRRELSRPEQQAQFRQDLEEILAPIRAAGLECSVLGWPLIEDEIRRTLWADLAWMLPAAGGVVAGVLWLTFRSWRIVGLMGVLQGMALLLVPGLAGLLACRLNAFTVMLFPLLAAIHLSLLVHLLDAWQKACALETDREAVMTRTLREVARPCAFAILTTAIGLLSLQVSEVRLVREFGRLGAAGAGLIYLISFGPGLAWLALLTTGQMQRNVGRLGARRELPIGRVLQSFCARYRLHLQCGALGALVLAGWGLAKMRTDVRAVEFLSPNSPTRRAVEQLDAQYGGVNVVQIEVNTGRPEGMNDPSFLGYLARLQRYAEEQPEVSAAYSYAQVLALMNQIWEGGNPGAFRLPESPWLINLFALALRAYPAPFLAGLADARWQKAFLIVRTRDMPAEPYLNVLHRILDFASAQRPPGVTVNAAEGIHTILEADRRILRSQTHSAAVTVLCMGLVLAGLWRSPRLAAMSMGINLVAVGLVLGLAGWAGITLNSVTVMVAAISLGIAVDDSVHFLTRWRHERRTGVPAEEALDRTLQVKARPIISSSLVLFGVFLVFQLSSFPPVEDFGLLAAAALAVALASVLVLLPALLSRPVARKHFRKVES